MSLREKYRHSKLLKCIVKAFGITMLAFALSLLLVQPLSFSAMSVFAPPEKDDFSISDFYAQVADKRPTRYNDLDIVIVDIGALDREGIASLIEEISLCGPRCVGLDVMFEEPRIPAVDSLLLNAIAANPGIVLPLNVAECGDNKFKISERPFFYKSIGGVEYGAANLPGKFRGSTIREFAISYPLDNGKTLPSFPVAIAKKVDSEAVKRLKDRGNNLETIDYPSREFNIIHPEELYDHADELTGKIVLVGAVTDIGDMHASPVNGYSSGIEIHALALSTVLGGRYYSSTSKIHDWLLAWILCYLVTLLGLLVDVRVKGLVVRILQFVLVYLAVQIGYSLYVDHRMIINFSYTLLMVTFGLFAADIWNGCTGLNDLIRKRLKKKHTSENISLDKSSK